MEQEGEGGIDGLEVFFRDLPKLVVEAGGLPNGDQGKMSGPDLVDSSAMLQPQHAKRLTPVATLTALIRRLAAGTRRHRYKSQIER